MKIIKLSSIFLLVAVMMFGFTSPVSAKGHSRSHKHYHYHKSKSRSTSFGFNLNLNPYPRYVENRTVFVQPAPVERITVYQPTVYGAPYVQQQVYYPGYYQQSVIVQPAPRYYVQPQVSWNTGWSY